MVSGSVVIGWGCAVGRWWLLCKIGGKIRGVEVSWNKRLIVKNKV
jgi:hypothetical protein